MHCTKSDSELSMLCFNDAKCGAIITAYISIAKKTCTEKIEARFIHPSYNDSKWGAIITAYLSIAQK